ncbi:unnamed protein product [Arctia plantaginis]|uniref:Uncharacterized protein n=1 Tax=Arctia plantaginis TaxID=874455 RepID=A0A8S0Z6C4_ARCPL|nr:unnamed protein product [Arctia plantaginis]CAB3236199.1 unnamed protein product [Arctia plantaginis]
MCASKTTAYTFRDIDMSRGAGEGGCATPLHWGRVQLTHRLQSHAALAHHSNIAHRSLGISALNCKRVRELHPAPTSTNRIS